MIRCCSLEKSFRARLLYTCFLINQLCHGVSMERPPGGACLLQDNWRKGMASVSPHAEFADFHPSALPSNALVDSNLRQQIRPNLLSKTSFSGISSESTSEEKQSTPHRIMKWLEGAIHLWPRLTSWLQLSSSSHPPRSDKGNAGSKLIMVPIGVLCLPMIGGIGIALYRCCAGGKQSSRKNKREASNSSHHTFLSHTPRALGRRMLLAGVLRHDTPTDLSASLSLSEPLPESDEDSGRRNQPANVHAEEPFAAVTHSAS